MQYNTIIIGGGVAGLSAGMYLARAGLPCLILEGKFWGGQTVLLNKVANYPAVKETTGFDIANTLYEQVKSLENVEALEYPIRADGCVDGGCGDAVRVCASRRSSGG